MAQHKISRLFTFHFFACLVLAIAAHVLPPAVLLAQRALPRASRARYCYVYALMRLSGAFILHAMPCYLPLPLEACNASCCRRGHTSAARRAATRCCYAMPATRLTPLIAAACCHAAVAAMRLPDARRVMFVAGYAHAAC